MASKPFTFDTCPKQALWRHWQVHDQVFLAIAICSTGIFHITFTGSHTYHRRVHWDTLQAEYEVSTDGGETWNKAETTTEQPTEDSHHVKARFHRTV